MPGRAITPAELAAFSSPYLDGGYQVDDLQLDCAEVGDGRITGVFSVPRHYAPPEGTFHFTLLLAFVAAARLAIIYAHIDNGIAVKRSEVLVRRFDLRCRQLITTSKDIDVTLALSEVRPLEGAIDYRGNIDVCDSRFVGEGSFYFPLPSES